MWGKIVRIRRNKTILSVLERGLFRRAAKGHNSHTVSHGLNHFICYQYQQTPSISQKPPFEHLVEVLIWPFSLAFY
jgi:hypothetical protein